MDLRLREAGWILVGIGRKWCWGSLAGLGLLLCLFAGGEEVDGLKAFASQGLIRFFVVELLYWFGAGIGVESSRMMAKRCLWSLTK